MESLEELWKLYQYKKSVMRERRVKDPELTGTDEENNFMKVSDVLKERAVMRLRNGAHVMFIAPRGRFDTERVVMAFHDMGNPHPWVTWAIDEKGGAFWGHYFSNPTEALADFRERIA